MNVGFTSPGVVFVDILDDFRTRLGADVLGATVMRLRGAVTMDDDHAVVGFRVFTQSTFGQLTNANGPIADPDADWFGYIPVLNRFQPAGEALTVDIDVQAARKLEELGQSILMAIEGTGPAGTTNVDMELSIGLKLP